MNKVILFAPNVEALKVHFAENDAPFSNRMDLPNFGFASFGKMVRVDYTRNGEIKDVRYLAQYKTKTESNGVQSVAMLKMSKWHLENIIKPLIDLGLVEPLGVVDPDSAGIDSIRCHTKKPWNYLSNDEMNKVYQAWPAGLIEDRNGNLPEFFGDVTL